MWHDRFGNCVAKIEWLDHALGLTARMACQSHCGLSVYGKKCCVRGAIIRGTIIQGVIHREAIIRGQLSSGAIFRTPLELYEKLNF